MIILDATDRYERPQLGLNNSNRKFRANRRLLPPIRQLPCQTVVSPQTRVPPDSLHLH
jgi:hypothetical protein